MPSLPRLLALLCLVSGAVACAKGTGASSDAGLFETDAGKSTPKPRPKPSSMDAAVPVIHDAGHPKDMVDAGDASADADTDAATDGGDAGLGNGCWGDASNFDPDDAALDFSADVALNCSPTIDTSQAVGAMLTGWCGTAPTPVIQMQTGGPSIVVVPMKSFTLDAGQSLYLVGDKPVVFAVTGDATINGTINAGASGSTPGAGGNVSCAAPNNGQVGSTPLNPYTTGSGGGGFGGAGGVGGTGWSSTAGGAGGTATMTANLIPLRGGCKGGDGFKGTGKGGAGGGAVQLTVIGTLKLGATGRIAAGGGGGMGGTGTNYAGGAGGGSGGAVLIEAGTLDQDASSLISANGGAGGGARFTADRPAGEDGHVNDGMPAVGSTTDNATFGGPGGNGGTSSSLDGAAGGETTPATKYSGGGGGGAYGIVIPRTLTIGGSC